MKFLCRGFAWEDFLVSSRTRWNFCVQVKIFSKDDDCQNVGLDLLLLRFLHALRWKVSMHTHSHTLARTHLLGHSHTHNHMFSHTLSLSRAHSTYFSLILTLSSFLLYTHTHIHARTRTHAHTSTPLFPIGDVGKKEKWCSRKRTDKEKKKEAV